MTLPEPSLPADTTPLEDTPSPQEPAARLDTPADSPDTYSLPDETPDAAAEGSTVESESLAQRDELPPPADPLPPVVSLSFAASLKAILLPSLAFLFVGLLAGLRVAAQAALPHIFEPGDYTNYQNVVDGLPVPRLLAWNTEQLDLLAGLRDLSGITLPLIALFVLGPLWLVIVRRVNPTFRLFTHAPAPAVPAANPLADTASDTASEKTATTRSSASAALSAPLEFYGLIKSLTLLVAIGLPIAAVWILVDWDDGGAVNSTSVTSNSGVMTGSVWAMRLALLGMAFWAGFHRDGIAGDFTSGEWNSDRQKLPLLALRGACFGLLAFAACRLGLPQHLDGLLLRLQTLGGFNIQTWNEIGGHVLLSFGLVWLALGGLFAFLSPPPHVRLHRALLLLPLGACLLAGLYQRRWTPDVLASRYDIRPATLQAIPEGLAYRPEIPNSGVPDGEAAAKELARQLNLPFAPPAHPDGRTLVLFTPRGTLLAFQNNLTIDGFAPDAKQVGQITQFLQNRAYQSALSWVASKNLFNVPLLRFDTAGAIRVSLQDLTHTPHNAQFAPMLKQMFSVCAATPENQALLDQWADETKFAFPDRESNRLMGDLYRRFDNIDKALTWYRRADMPPSFLQRVRAERPLYRDGNIHGVLRWNGQPLVGAQVAVVPSLMNGLPLDMEPLVHDAIYGMENMRQRYYFTLFPQFHPFPLQLRFISASATTDSKGAYRIDHLTEGTYSAICTLPNGIQTRLPFDNRLQITHPISAFNLNYSQSGYDAGTTEFKW